MTCQAGAQLEGVAISGTDCAWIRRILRDSIYLWACGEKTEDGDQDLKLTDRLIGWLILFMQGFSLTMLIVLDRATSKSDTAGSPAGHGEWRYLLPSVTGSMYLLVASTTHDLRAGFSLMVDGSCAGHRAFGIALLIVYGIMMSAAMTVLMSTSDDSASVVLNAVTVLFIADLDEKTLHFMSTIPQEWRLFWAMQSIGISFALALIAVAYVGDASPILRESTDLFTRSFPTYFLWGVSPAVVTWGSFRLSSALQTICEFFEASEHADVDMATSSFVLSRVLVGFLAILKHAHKSVREEPFFFVVKSAWLAQAVGSWVLLGGVIGPPIAFTFVDNTPPSNTLSLVLSDHKLTLVVLNLVLVIGLVAKVIELRRTCAKARARYNHYGTAPFLEKRPVCRETKSSYMFSCAFFNGRVGHWVLDDLPTVRVRRVLGQTYVGKRPIYRYTCWLRCCTEFVACWNFHVG